MQTVNFKCGHCGSLMGVSQEHLGHQVRCPTCQQVVLAPATSPEPPSPFEQAAPSADRAREDVFSPPSATEDALLGGAEGPKLELPSEPAPPAPAPAPFPELPPASATNGETASSTALPGPATPGPAEPPPWSPVSAPPDGAPPAPAEGEPAARRREQPRVNWVLPLVVLPLAVWALGATAAAIWGWVEVVKANRRPSLFEQFPDVEGDNPGVRKGKATSRLNWARASATDELPARLRVPLGGVLTVGALEVRPLKVERARVAVHTEGDDDGPRRMDYESLVLTLRLKNLAEDYSFSPLDNYFDRHWEGDRDGPPPLTVLQAGKALFWGGSHHWAPRDGKGRRAREWLDAKGRNDGGAADLAPGASMEAAVATNGEDADVQSVLFGLGRDGRPVGKPYQGPLLWRVQVRRGLVPWRGKERPACAVVGVEFDSSAYASKAD